MSIFDCLKESITEEMVQSKDYQDINIKVAESQRVLKKSLSHEQLAMFMYYEDATAELMDYSNKFFFEKGQNLK